MSARTASGGARWTAELAFPKPRGGSAQNGFWGFNAARRLMGQPRRWLVWTQGGREPGEPEHLGRLVFERSPCYIADVRMSQPHVGINRYAVKMVNTSRASFAGRLTAIVNPQSGRSRRTDFKVSVDAGEHKWYTIHHPIKRAGTGTLALALYPQSSQAPVSLAVRTDFEVKPVVDLRLRPAYCAQGEFVHGTMAVNPKDAESQQTQAKPDLIVVNVDDRKSQQTGAVFTLRRKGRRRSIHTQSVSITSDRTYSIRAPTEGLRVGRYELEAKVVMGGEAQGTAEFEFAVFDNF